MSTENDKIKHSQRLFNDEIAVKKQQRIAKSAYQIDSQNRKEVIQPHRLHKRHAMDCGKPRCTICGNRRKIFKEQTAQEKKLFQDIDTPNNRKNNGLNSIIKENE